MASQVRGRVTRRGLLGTTSTVAGALLAACGGQQAAGPKPVAAPGAATVEFFHEWDGVRTKLVDDMIADFQAAYPNITVRPTLTRQNLTSEQVFTAVVGGSPPNVVNVYSPTSVVWAQKGARRWLDDLLKKDKIAAEQAFYRATMDLLRFDGRYYALPALVAGGDPFLMYNARVFAQFGLDPAEPPKTWQDGEAASARVTERQGNQVTRIGLVPWQEPFWEWLYLNDGRLFSPDGKKVVFNDPQGQETLAWLVDFTQRVYGGKAAVNEFSQNSRTADPFRGPRLPWYNGREAMWATIVSMFFRIGEEEPGFPLGAAQPPYNAKNPRANVATVADAVYTYVMPQGAKEQEAGWLWHKYITLGEGGKKFLLAQKRPSPVRRFTEDKAYRDLNPHWDVVLKNLDSAVSAPPTPAWADIIAAMDKATSDALDGRLGVKQALDQAAEAAQTAVDTFKL